MTKDEIIAAIDEVIDPSKMEPEEALDFLDSIVGDLDERSINLQEKLNNKEEEK